MFKAEQYIQQEALLRWIHNWNEAIYADYYTQQINDRMKRRQVSSSMEENIVKIKKICRDKGKDLDFHQFMQLMDRIIFHCYFKQGNSALHIANYYEEILVPVDQHTRNRMMALKAGQRQLGSMDIRFQDKIVAQLSEQSDLFRLIFDASFLTEDELFNQDNVPLSDDGLSQLLLATGSESFFTLKIWDHVGENDIEKYVDLMLYHCSTKLDLHFKRTSFEPPISELQHALKEEIQFQPLQLEKLPLLFFNAASHNLAPEVVFMSYYHSIAYFFERAINFNIRTKIQEMFVPEDLQVNREIRRMAKAVNALRESFSEKEALKLVLDKALDFQAFMDWLEAESERKEGLVLAQESYKELPLLDVTSRKVLLRSLVNRIYSLKATLAEERENKDEFIWVKQLDDPLLVQEVPLIRWLASQTLECWSVVE